MAILIHGRVRMIQTLNSHQPSESFSANVCNSIVVIKQKANSNGA